MRRDVYLSALFALTSALFCGVGGLISVSFEAMFGYKTAFLAMGGIIALYAWIYVLVCGTAD